MKTFAIICLVITSSIAFAERSTNDVSVYSGIGIVVSTNDGLQVARVAIGSPADAGDIHSFDRIIKIDGRNTAGMSLSEASSLLRGPEGSITTLIILGITNGATRELEITRAVLTTRRISDGRTRC
jgi:C-terminal processing protease CtpA/Prc